MLKYDDVYGPPKEEPKTNSTSVSSVGNLPALWWVGVLIALIIIRLVYEFAE